MLKIRLQRIGKKNQPSFRLVLVEHTFRPQGKYIEDLGSYNPKSKQKQFNKERILHWISKGAQLSPTVHNFLVDEKIIDKAKVKAWKPKKKPAPAETTVSKPAEQPLETPSVEVVKEEIKQEEPKIEQGASEGPQSVGVDTQPKTE